MSKSVIVKYDLPPYLLVHDADFRRKKMESHTPTTIGYFRNESVIAVVDRKIGRQIKLELGVAERDYRNVCSLAKRHLETSIEKLLAKNGITPAESGKE